MNISKVPVTISKSTQVYEFLSSKIWYVTLKPWGTVNVFMYAICSCNPLKNSLNKNERIQENVLVDSNDTIFYKMCIIDIFAKLIK